MKKIAVLTLASFVFACSKPPSRCGQSSSVSSLKSGNNGVTCDVSYSAVMMDKLQGIKIEEFNPKDSEKIRHLNELNSMPVEFLDIMRGGITIGLTHGGITNIPKFASLKGQTPRGWTDGSTWDDVPGAGPADYTALGDSFMTNGAMSLAIHEGAHSVTLRAGVERSKEFLAAWNAEKGKPHPSDYAGTYRANHDIEYLAMAIDDYYCSKKTRDKLKEMYPKAYAFVENDLIRLLKESGKGKPIVVAPTPDPKPETPGTKPEMPDTKPNVPETKPVPEGKPLPEIDRDPDESTGESPESPPDEGDGDGDDDGDVESGDAKPKGPAELPDPPRSHGLIRPMCS